MWRALSRYSRTPRASKAGPLIILSGRFAGEERRASVCMWRLTLVNLTPTVSLLSLSRVASEPSSSLPRSVSAQDLLGRWSVLPVLAVACCVWNRWKANQLEGKLEQAKLEEVSLRPAHTDFTAPSEASPAVYASLFRRRRQKCSRLVCHLA